VGESAGLPSANRDDTDLDRHIAVVAIVSDDLGWQCLAGYQLTYQSVIIHVYIVHQAEGFQPVIYRYSHHGPKSGQVGLVDAATGNKIG
jgi:hypothetical protein